MIEIYFLLAMITNVLADLLIWIEVKQMRKAHQTVVVQTDAMKITMSQTQEELKEARMGFKEFSETLGPALSDHAKLTAKAIGGVIGYYQGKAQEGATEELSGLQSTLEQLGPLAQMISQSPTNGNSGNGKFHT